MTNVEMALPPEDAAFVDELRTFLDGAFPGIDAIARDLPGAVASASYFTHEFCEELDDRTGYSQRLADHGLRGVDWPTEHGGAGRTAVQQWLFLEELAHRRLPAGGVTLWSIGRTIIRHGTPAQRNEFLPGILRGEIEFALGYTEPDVGTDLAALRTRAERDGDRYRITGQKLYTTGAHHATHLWVAARTGTADARHRGISVFAVPADSPGITVRPVYTQAGERTNEVYLDAVTVPATARIGEEDGGWAVIMTAINFERLHTAGGIARDIEELVRWCDEAGLHDAAVDAALTELVVDLRTGILLAMRSAVLVDAECLSGGQAAMVKVWLSELRERVAATALDLMGPEGQLSAESPDAPVDGAFEELYRYFPVRKFAAGTNESLRDLIARDCVGLSREER